MRTTKRYLPVAAALLLLSSLTACSDSGDDGPTVPAGPVPEGLEKFYAQQLEWGECAPYATNAMARQAFAGDGLECARLTVPLSYAEPQGTTITVGLLRRQASDPGSRIGSLVLNPGGPGGSGMTAAAQLSSAVGGTELGERFDFVGFDPRGIGASEPAVDCLTDAEMDADRADLTAYDGIDDVADAEKDAEDFAAKCVERTRHGEKMLANLGTRDVVRDMDVLRSALGDEKLTYLGYSYGTRIGYTYAETFPRNVRALLLDGAVDPEQDMVEALVAQAEGFGGTFGEFVKWCAGRADCALGRDPSAAVGIYQDLVRPLLDEPVALPDGRVLSYEDATTGTVAALYSRQVWPTLNQGLAALGKGDGAVMMALADMYYERGPDGKYASTHEGLVAIRCVDDPPVTDRERIEAAQAEYVEKAEFLDPGLPPSAARDACAFWPVEHTSEPHLPDVEGVPPTLVVSTTNDPATPYQAGVNLAKAMDGRLLTFDGAQHTAFLSAGSDCVDKAGVAYLVDGTLPPEGTRCG
ncbi:alpha/beta hydrolase [Saccharomonospora xinjiangensis]|uniref:alpha/beta hydrolase n=1 Tax=Saccharomonospora xinjiangensis TaxID=75294 RepID=UPI00106F9310|nr:alpha/beta hydrolase [Saccharomonospora xinjiangensis]QBQ59190.1 Carboxylesterase A precursor [Saccharomonospora xinjiangensis]